MRVQYLQTMQRWSRWLMASASKAEEPQGSGGSNPSRCVKNPIPFFFWQGIGFLFLPYQDAACRISPLHQTYSCTVIYSCGTNNFQCFRICNPACVRCAASREFLHAASFSRFALLMASTSATRSGESLHPPM